MGTALERTHAVTDLAARAGSYGMPSAAVDGMDVLAVRAATAGAVASVRGGRGPFFLELRTYRFRAHSMYDPDRYRDKAEIARWKRRDPIDRLLKQLRDGGVVDAAELVAMETAIAAEIDAAVAAADAAPVEDVADLTRFLLAERGARNG